MRRAGEDHLRYHELIGRAAQLLFAAQARPSGRLGAGRQVVADPTDAGTLAGLNAYGHDWLRGKAVEVGWAEPVLRLPDGGAGGARGDRLIGGNR